MLYAAWKQGAFQDRLSHLGSDSYPHPGSVVSGRGWGTWCAEAEVSFWAKMAIMHIFPIEKSHAKPAFSVSSACDF